MTAPLVKVRDLAEQVRGVTYDKLDASKTQRDGFLPILRANNITDDGLIFDDLVFVPRERVFPKQRIRPNDVVVAASSGSLDVVGKAAPLQRSFEGSFGAFCKVLRPNARVHPGYFAHFFKTQFYRQRVSKLAAGANINNLRNEHLDEFEILLPNLAEQSRIAAILDSAEALRSKRREAIGLLQELTWSIFSELFGDFLRNTRGWQQQRLLDLLSMPLRNGVSPSNSGQIEGKVLTLSAITGSHFKATAWKTGTFASPLSENQAVDERDFLICRGNGNVQLVGKGYFATQSMPQVAFPDTIIAARVSSGLVERYFLQTVWNSTVVRRQIESLARTTNGTYKVNQTILESIRFPVPPLSLQCEFAERAALILRLEEVQKSSLSELDALFASLQHRAFQGEL